ncbi:glycosyltransferase family 1 protein [Marssonina coronariae]|uniref:Glycosyltransferase family 1 protein n=1 Tax=Diplocarpon coronariae TaxID=2795749 RepID=A0A218YZW1_9HELO|nr:glycosyltransferase family 1 protein [Marssonina coronariae]
MASQPPQKPPKEVEGEQMLSETPTSRLEREVQANIQGNSVYSDQTFEPSLSEMTLEESIIESYGGSYDESEQAKARVEMDAQSPRELPRGLTIGVPAIETPISRHGQETYAMLDSRIQGNPEDSYAGSFTETRQIRPPVELDAQSPWEPPRGSTIEESINKTSTSRPERKASSILASEAEERRIESLRRPSESEQSIIPVENMERSVGSEAHQMLDGTTNKNKFGSVYQPRETMGGRFELPEQSRTKSFYEPRLQRRPLPARTINEDPTSSRSEKETLAMLEGNYAQSESNESPPGSAAPSIASGSVDWDAPPAYDQSFGDDTHNGRVSMFFTGDQRFTALPPLPTYDSLAEKKRTHAENSYSLLNIVIQVVGSRGDVQPFVALGQELLAVGHRVRLATHNVFEDFVRSAGLEFYPIGGDPADLMAYMVKNPGIIPKFATLKSGEISKKRKMVSEMLDGCWRSCTEPDPSTNIPFVAEAIIANPPSFAHVHCAQALGIPVHLMFTMPWSPTRSFPHPLANVQITDTDPTTTNFLSYGLVDMMTWQGLGSVINHWRRKSLNLEPFSAMVGAGLLGDLKIPFTYCWSPALIPRPFDWPAHIDVCGFFFRNAPEYTPFPELDAFLKAGMPPIYIGFGSIVMENPDRMTETIIGAVKSCGVRAIVSEGWSKLGKGAAAHPDILFIGDCPHEWLFKHVSAVVHHGGAGTTACGLLNGRPTAIVPFFGDQPFWANMVAVAGAGPRPIEHKSLNAESLSRAIQVCLNPATILAAKKISEKMKDEDGVRAAVTSFHRNLPIQELNCDIIPRHPANWCWKNGMRTLKLSHRAASILVEHKKIEVGALKLHNAKPIVIENRRWDPLTATTSAGVDSVKNIYSAMGEAVNSPIQEYRRIKTFENDQTETGSIHSNVSTRSNATGAAGKAVGRGFGKVGLALTKSAIDIPRAVADGMHNVPELYGEKSLGHGFYDGYVGFFTQPYKGARDGGALGLMKGIAKGCGGLLTQPAHGMFGVLAYPALGLYRNLNTEELTGTQGDILRAQQAYGMYLAEHNPVQQSEVVQVLKDFEDLLLNDGEPDH